MQVFVLILEFKINYVCLVVGECLIVCVEVQVVSKIQVVCCCEVYVVKDGGEKFCVLVQGIIVCFGGD